MLKILQVRLQQYVNHELQDVQGGFRKDRGTRNQIAKIHWNIKKVREFQKNIYFCFIDYAKAFDCVDHNKLYKSSRGRSSGLVISSLSELSTVYCDPHSQGFGILNKAEVDAFLELACFFDGPADVGNLISDSSAFSKTSLNIWKFTVHVLLKPGLENFERYFASM